MKRAKRFNAGEEVEGKDFGGSSGSGEYAPAAPAKKQSFSEAFKNAEDGSTFEWQGKKYKKEYASETKAAPSKPAPKVEEPAKPAPKAAEPAKPAPSKPESKTTSAVPKKYERPDIGGAIGRGVSSFFGSIRERGKQSNPDAYAKGGSVSSASKRADGIAQRGKTRGKMC